jgi:hypothetical protein
MDDVEARAATEARGVAVPVALRCEAMPGDALRRWVEGILGWQTVEDDPDGPVPPVVRLVDVANASAPGPDGDVPTLLVVDGSVRAVEAARAARLCAPAGVLSWPEDRASLPTLVAGITAGHGGTNAASRTLRVGGASGGVGTTTVTLALAGLAGWTARRTLAVVRDHAPVGPATRIPADAVNATDLWSRAWPLPGVGGVRVVVVDGAARGVTPDVRGADLVVVDAGVDVEVDVLVCRPDAPALESVPTTTAGAVVVCGDGIVPLARIVAAAGGRRVVVLPHSVRVARAHLRGRVPTGLPGRWLRPLLALVDDGRGRARWDERA